MAKNKKQIIPLRDRILVERLEEKEEKTPSGIIIPATVEKERPQTGRVIAVGEGAISEKGKLIAMKVKAGDTVLFSKYGPDEVEIDGEEYIIINESNILAIIK